MLKVNAYRWRGALCAAAASYLIGLVAAADDGAWVNVRDFGASGSQFESVATTQAGSNKIALKDIGDFKAGQGVMVSRCNIQYSNAFISGPGSAYGPRKPLDGVAEIRGYDGSAGSWLVYVLDFQSANPATFRFTDNLLRGNKWTAMQVAVTGDWQPLSRGIEIRLLKRDLEPGHMIAFTARDQLVTTIEKVEGNTIIVKDAANRSATDAVARHCDHMAIQAAVTQAIKEKRNVFIPNGYYRLARGVSVSNASAIRIEGASGVDTVMDISDGTGAVFGLSGGTEVNIRNFRMIGHTPKAEMPGAFASATGNSFWCCALRGCNAVTLSGTERILVENVHASRMASECFYSQGPGRTSKDEPKTYTKSATYLRCSVTDCAANAFNNNDTAENTSVLYCRVDGAGWQAYEGPGRFVRLIGNYIRDGGTGLWVGSMSHRLDDLHALGCGQTVIADNVIEGIGKNNRGIYYAHGATQAVIANNLFINYNATAIEVTGWTGTRAFPAQNVTVTGNIIDLTSDEKAPPRTGIKVSTSDTLVSNNQVYVRGALDPKTTGISVSEPAVNVTVHDNLIRSCGAGIRTGVVSSRVTEVLDPMTFLEKGLPLEWRNFHCYRGWSIAWKDGGTKPISIVDSFDWETLRLKLKEPREVKVGDGFDIFPPSADWSLHDNTITGCAHPVVLGSYGSETSVLKDNTISRGEATGVKVAVEVRGQFKIIGNHIVGFDEPGAAAFGLYPDPIGRACRNLYQGNIIERCSTVVPENSKALWEASLKEGNVTVEAGNVR